MMIKRFLMNLAALTFAIAFAAQTFAAQGASASSKEITVRGRLQPTVEAGGWVIASGEEKFLLLNANKFKNESWFKEGAQVEAVGEKKDVMTIHMEGTPFEARTLRPIKNDDTSGNGASHSAAELTRVTVSGEATIQAQPDTAIVSIAVVTQNASASEAQAENASKTEAVVRAVKAAAGQGAEVKTAGYSLQPQYTYRQNDSPQITGYMARNSVVVTLSDLTKVGPVIDAASRAGANTVDGLSFTLKQDRPARTRALTDATRDAMSKARTIAEALGGRVVRVLEVQEGSIYRPPVPMPYQRTMLGKVAEAASAPDTPIEVGSLDIRAQVQLVVEIEARP